MAASEGRPRSAARRVQIRELISAACCPIPPVNTTVSNRSSCTAHRANAPVERWIDVEGKAPKE
jgi:hypothetical protein